MSEFYDGLPRETVFLHLTDTNSYTPLPNSWQIGVADVAGSTQHVAAGRYKTINMVGAAVISAVMNAHNGTAFPFVFGGDGASFAVDPDQADTARIALSAVARWAQTEFNVDLRVALVPVVAVRDAGHDVSVARFQVSDGADYAMFTGGGLSWAEMQMKSGHHCIQPAALGVLPDLTGLSCRWAHMAAQNGTILSLVIVAEPTAPLAAISDLYREIITLAEGLARGGHPAPTAGMEAKWPPAGAQLEAHAAQGHGSFKAARRKALFESFVAWALIRTGLKIGGFDARRYARVVAENADFRKLDDGLKMTLDCDQTTKGSLVRILDQAAAAGIIRYGVVTQKEAMMTCIVPSIMTDDHLHFIDGASGGYTQAAMAIKEN